MRPQCTTPPPVLSPTPEEKVAIRARMLAALAAADPLWLTRPELMVTAGVSVRQVTWALDALMQAGEIRRASFGHRYEYRLAPDLIIE